MRRELAPGERLGGIPVAIPPTLFSGGILGVELLERTREDLVRLRTE